MPALELADRLGLAITSIDPYLALAPITREELLEAVQRCEPEFMRLAGGDFDDGEPTTGVEPEIIQMVGR